MIFEQDSTFPLTFSISSFNRARLKNLYSAMTKRSVLTFAVLFASFPEGTSAASLTLRSSRLRGSSQGHRHLADSQYSQTELEYFQNCENLFLSDSVVGDGLISQKDFASTFDTLCSRYSTGGSCKTFGFNSLASNLQTTFFEAVCSTMEDSMACASNLRSLNSMDFGYIVSSETMPQVQMRVETFCLELLEDVFGKFFEQMGNQVFTASAHTYFSLLKLPTQLHLRRSHPRATLQHLPLTLLQLSLDHFLKMYLVHLTVQNQMTLCPMIRMLMMKKVLPPHLKKIPLIRNLWT